MSWHDFFDFEKESDSARLLAIGLRPDCQVGKSPIQRASPVAARLPARRRKPMLARSILYLPTMARKVSRNRAKPRRNKSAAATPALNALMAAGHSAAQHRKGRSVSTDLAAPMTGEIERQLERLIGKFGYERVRDALAALMA
jgi:hypothetical protein